MENSDFHLNLSTGFLGFCWCLPAKPKKGLKGWDKYGKVNSLFGQYWNFQIQYYELPILSNHYGISNIFQHFPTIMKFPTFSNHYEISNIFQHFPTIMNFGVAHERCYSRPCLRWAIAIPHRPCWEGRCCGEPGHCIPKYCWLIMVNIG